MVRDVAMGSHSVHACLYHVVWATKYRYKLLDLVDPAHPRGTGFTVSDRLKELVFEKADQRGWEVRAVETMPDHVHLFVRADPATLPHYLAAQFKGYTSKVLREEFPVLMRRAPSLWTRSYFIATAGSVSAATIQAYVENQRSKYTPRGSGS